MPSKRSVYWKLAHLVFSQWMSSVRNTTGSLIPNPYKVINFVGMFTRVNLKNYNSHLDNSFIGGKYIFLWLSHTHRIYFIFYIFFKIYFSRKNNFNNFWVFIILSSQVLKPTTKKYSIIILSFEKIYKFVFFIYFIS